jgi:uncharacterized protein YndB with AHSA1/START domain
MTNESKKRSPHAMNDGDTILATAEISAPPERVFRALPSDEVEQWWESADTHRVNNWTADLQAGGQWSFGTRLPDGKVFTPSGEFIEIDKPNKIVQVRRYDWGHPTLERRVTTVTYRLNSIATGACVSVRHDGFGGISEAANEHARGWGRFLGWLEAYPEHDC